jgi:hypothetical protein
MNEDNNKRELIDSILKETDDKLKGSDVGDGKEIISGDSNNTSDLYFKVCVRAYSSSSVYKIIYLFILVSTPTEF